MCGNVMEGSLDRVIFVLDFEIGHCNSVYMCGIVIMGKEKGQFCGMRDRNCS